MNKTSVNTKNLLKFILGSAFGILMFLVPIPYNDSFTTLLEFCKNFLKDLFGGSLIYILTVLVCIGSAVGVILIAEGGLYANSVAQLQQQAMELLAL